MSTTENLGPLKQKSPRARRRKATAEAGQNSFLAAYAKTGSITEATALSKISSARRHYDWLKNVSGYAERFAEAHTQAVEALEVEARRRAVDGVEEPVFHKGVIVGHIQRYSDHLLMFLLRGVMPGKYRERIQAEVSGPDGEPIRVAVAAAIAKVYGQTDTSLDISDVRKTLREAQAEPPGAGEAKGGASDVLRTVPEAEAERPRVEPKAP